MKDFKTFINENILIPRNIEGRKEKLKQMNIRLLSQEVIDGDLDLDDSFTDIDSKFVKVKKVNGYVRLSISHWTEIPVWLKDVEITGSFICAGNRLISLKNCPQKVGGNFYCGNNQLISLEGCPEKIEGSFNCYNNLLSSLKGCPEIIGDNFYCGNNKTKLELPDFVKLKGDFYN